MERKMMTVEKLGEEAELDKQSFALDFGFDDGDDIDDDEETYIEIALEPDHNQEEKREAKSTSFGGNDDEESEMVSLSSGVSLKAGSSTTSTTTTSNSSGYTAEDYHGEAIKVDDPGIASSSSSSSSEPTAERGYTFSPINRITNDKNRRNAQALAQFPVLMRRLLNSFLLTFRPSFQEDSRVANDDPKVAMNTIDRYSRWEPVRSRRKTSKVRSTNGGVVMEFLIKFRSISIRSIVTSFLIKPQQTNVNSSRGSTSTTHHHHHRHNTKTTSKERLKTYGRLMIKPFDRWSEQREQQQQQREDSKSSNVMEMDMEPSCGKGERLSPWRVFVVKMINIGHKGKATKSCPNPTKPCPIYARDNSVQAAIAHCKRSLG